MTILNKTLATATIALIAAGGSAFAAGHTLDVNEARLDMMLDQNGDGTVDNDEIIRGNMAVFDADANGFVDADERGVAEEMLMSGNMIELAPVVDVADTSVEVTFDAAAARLDTMLDQNGDGTVDDDEIIRGNMALFDTDNNGSLDADERGVAEQVLMGSSMPEVDLTEVATSTKGTVEFNGNAARLDMMLDTNGDGTVTDNEIIDGNVATFDTDGDGMLNANERNEAEIAIMN